MRKFENIIQSETAPDINSLWMKDGELLWFNNGKWSPVCTCFSNDTEEDLDSEYTIIEGDETVADDANITNLSNGTGYRYATPYVPSGHITKILSNCHRYLGKLITPGKTVMLEGNPNDPDINGREFPGRDSSGTMLVCQLADDNSTFFNTGYDSPYTKRTANLDGLTGHGEVYSVIKGFWYKGINYTPAIDSDKVSFRYTCYSSKESKPSKSDETRVLSIEELNKTSVTNSIKEGLYKENMVLQKTGVSDTVTDRELSKAGVDIYRINVKGYKKVRFPASVKVGCCLFTDKNGKIITDSNNSVERVGEISVDSDNWLYTGMAVMADIPQDAIYFYIVVNRFVSGQITSDPCDIVLHKGSKFNSGAEMTDENAKEWIADMEPDWVYSEPVCIAAAECAENEGNLYTSFDGTKIAVVGTENKKNELNSTDQWFQYRFSNAAYKRGLQLTDYEATKLIAMLFMARYGRRNSQNQLGSGTSTAQRKLGETREYGMIDTVIPDDTQIPWNNAAIAIIKGAYKSFKNVNNPNFLGIENIHGNVHELLDRAYYVNETKANCSKIRITNPDLTIRRLYSIAPKGYFSKSVVHGKYCDIANCSPQGGNSETFYPDYQIAESQLYSTWKSVYAIRGSGYHSEAYGGVFCLITGYSVNFSYKYSGVRLIFRGNIIETTDVEEFMKANEFRG